DVRKFVTVFVKLVAKFLMKPNNFPTHELIELATVVVELLNKFTTVDHLVLIKFMNTFVKFVISVRMLPTNDRDISPTIKSIAPEKVCFMPSHILEKSPVSKPLKTFVTPIMISREPVITFFMAVQMYSTTKSIAGKTRSKTALAPCKKLVTASTICLPFSD